MSFTPTRDDRGDNNNGGGGGSTPPPKTPGWTQALFGFGIASSTKKPKPIHNTVNFTNTNRPRPNQDAIQFNIPEPSVPERPSITEQGNDESVITGPLTSESVRSTSSAKSPWKSPARNNVQFSIGSSAKKSKVSVAKRRSKPAYKFKPLNFLTKQKQPYPSTKKIDCKVAVDALQKSKGLFSLSQRQQQARNNIASFRMSNVIYGNGQRRSRLPPPDSSMESLMAIEDSTNQHSSSTAAAAAAATTTPAAASFGATTHEVAHANSNKRKKVSFSESGNAATGAMTTPNRPTDNRTGTPFNFASKEEEGSIGSSSDTSSYFSIPARPIRVEYLDDLSLDETPSGNDPGPVVQDGIRNLFNFSEDESKEIPKWGRHPIYDPNAFVKSMISQAKKESKSVSKYTTDDQNADQRQYWECTNCHTSNADDESKCTKCGAKRESKVDPNGWGDFFKRVTTGKWKCESCCNFNDNSATKCPSCEADRPDVGGSEYAEKDVKRPKVSPTNATSTNSSINTSTKPFIFSSSGSSNNTSSSGDVFTFGGSTSNNSSTTSKAATGFTFNANSNDKASSAASGKASTGGGFTFAGATSGTSSSATTTPAKSAFPGFTFDGAPAASNNDAAPPTNATTVSATSTPKATSSGITFGTNLAPAPATASKAVSGFQFTAPSIDSGSVTKTYKGTGPGFSLPISSNKRTSSSDSTKEQKHDFMSTSFGSSSETSSNKKRKDSAPTAPFSFESSGKSASTADQPATSKSGLVLFGQQKKNSFVSSSTNSSSVGDNGQSSPTKNGNGLPSGTSGGTKPSFTIGSLSAPTPAPIATNTSSKETGGNGLSAPKAPFAFGSSQAQQKGESAVVGAAVTASKPSETTPKFSFGKSGAPLNLPVPSFVTDGAGTNDKPTFGSSGPPPGAGMAFGGGSTPAPAPIAPTPLFGAATPAKPADKPQEAPAPPPAVPPLFGAATPAKPATNNTPAPVAPTLFGQTSSNPNPFGSASTPAPAPATPAPSFAFGSSVATAATPAPTTFGSNNTPAPAPMFGGSSQPAAPAAPFGSASQPVPAPSAPFGTSFGTTPATPAPSFGFGGAPPVPSTGGMPGFGAPPAGGAPPFGTPHPPPSATPAFGATPQPPNGTQPFGSMQPPQGATPGFGASQPMTGFGSSTPQPNLTTFGSAQPPQSGGFGGGGFNAPTTTPGAGGGFSIGSGDSKTPAGTRGRRRIKARRPTPSRNA